VPGEGALRRSAQQFPFLSPFRRYCNPSDRCCTTSSTLAPEDFAIYHQLLSFLALFAFFRPSNYSAWHIPLRSPTLLHYAGSRRLRWQLLRLGSVRQRPFSCRVGISDFWSKGCFVKSARISHNACGLNARY
jgi:hypothetical protein